MEISYLYFLLIPSLYIITTHFIKKIRNLPPSPILTLPILGHLYLLKKPLHRSLAKISQKIGPIILLQFGSRPVLVVSSPSVAEECLHKNDVVFANRPHLLAGKYIGYNYTSLAWASYGDHWRNLRKISSLEILSTHRLQMLHSIRVDEVKFMLKRVFKISQDQEIVDMKTMFFELMLNVMMRMIAGKKYFGEKDGDVEQANRFREIVIETFQLAGATNIGDFLPMLGSKGLEDRLVKLKEKRDAFIQELVDECRSKIKNGDGGDDLEFSGKKKCLIEVLLGLREKEPEYYTDELIKSLMLVLLSAGTDTSAGTIEWALSSLLNHPEILKKAQKEIDEQIGQERLVDESDIPNLPYLRCIMHETMRMFPAGPLLVPHQSSEKCKIGGYNVPGGTMLLVNLFAIQNDPKLWDQPTKFMPERFEGMEGTRDGYKFMPFGTGRRSCPGEGLANRMVGLTIGSLLQCFDWERVGKEMIDMKEGIGLTLPKAQPLMAKPRPRPILLNLLSQN
ncbi:oxygenase [Lithospermum erythrorhizon]|uniref:Oxygenase n=1 Tax=Lithospermum erythrorhizon TaxID=34254 RepID=A0AAV3Q2Y7_LITER